MIMISYNILQKRLIFQKYKKCSPGKYAMDHGAIRSGSIRWISMRFDALYSDVTSVNSVFVSDKMINNSDNFRIKWLSYSKISAIICVPYFLFLHFISFWKTCQLMWENFVFLVIFDIVYNWSISLLLVSEFPNYDLNYLPSKLADILFEINKCWNL